MKKRSGRLRVVLVCTECQARNYRTSKSRSSTIPAEGTTTEPLSLKKFCPACNQHTLHIESK